MSDGERRSSWHWTLFRYTLGPVLAIVLMIVLVTWSLSSQKRPLSGSEPISQQYQTVPEGSPWQPFSEAARRQALSDSKLVLVHFVNGSPESLEKRNALCRLPRLQAIFDQGRVKPMLADLFDAARASEVMTAYSRLGVEQCPVIAIYLPGVDEPTVFESDWSEEELLQSVTH